jgi:hypothetical protein
MLPDLVAIAIAGVLLVLVGIRFSRYRNHPWDIYYPKLAWLRAGIWFCVCWLLACWTGVLRLVVESPLATPEQLADPAWWLHTAAVYLFILVAYAGVWSWFTPIFDRPRNIPVSAVFGLLWGSSSGLLFLSVWQVSGLAGLEGWWRWGATFLALGVFQPNWHSIWWDHYIAPEHDTPMTQKIKALGCHIPNLLITLTYLLLHGNAALFAGAQVVACLSAAVGMRYPAPWLAPSARNYAHRSKGLIPRCTGYVSEDPLTDPYTPFYPGWRGTKKSG